jgi:hypothetical protein
MSRDTLPLAVAKALQAAGATREMISAARVAFGTCQDGYRAKGAARQRALRERRRSNVTPRDAREISGADLTPRDVTGADLLQALSLAGRGNFDLSASFEPIRALLDQGCELEADKGAARQRALRERRRNVTRDEAPQPAVAPRDVIRWRLDEEQATARPSFSADAAARAPRVQ